MLLPPLLGTRILDPVNVIVALTVYTVALLVRTVADGLSAVPRSVVNSATAMGYGPLRRFAAVELPLSVPVVVAGLRVAAVSNISLVTVGAVIGFGGLGKMFTDGFQRDIPAEIVTGIVLVLLLALSWTGCSCCSAACSRRGTGWAHRRGARMNVFSYLLDPAHWTGPQGIPVRLSSTSVTSLLTLLIALRDRGADRRVDRPHRPRRLPRGRPGERAARPADAWGCSC